MSDEKTVPEDRLAAIVAAAVRDALVQKEQAKPPRPVVDHSFFVNQLTRRYTFATLDDTYEILLYQDGVYRPGGEAFIRREVEHHFIDLAASAKHQLVEEVLHGVQRRSLVPRSRFNPAGKLCLKNGVLDLRSLEMGPHTVNDPFTTLLPVEFVPGAEAPRWCDFIDEVQPKKDVREAMQMGAGYNLSPRNEHHKAFLLYGGGNNGKSVYLSGIAMVLGEENVAASTLQALAMDRFASSELYGKLANICADIPSKPIDYTGQFKMLTGEDLVTAQRKYSHPFRFRWGGKAWFSANEFPRVTDQTVAFWRRWEAWDFPVDFTGREDRELIVKFQAERPGILQWMVQGLRMLRERGSFPRTFDADALKETWHKHADPVFWFVSECVEPDSAGEIEKDDLYEAYTNFCAANGARRDSPEQVHGRLPNLVPSVRQKRPRAGRDSRKYVWAGIRWSEGAARYTADVYPPDQSDHPDQTGRQGSLDKHGGPGGQGGPGATKPAHNEPPKPSETADATSRTTRTDGPRVHSPEPQATPCAECMQIPTWRVSIPDEMFLKALCAAHLRNLGLEPPKESA